MLWHNRCNAFSGTEELKKEFFSVVIHGEDTAMNELIDRRRSPRVPCDLSVEYKLRGGRIREGRLTNIGIGGIVLTMHVAPPPVGADLLFRFRLPRSPRPVQAVGSVRWAAPGRAGVEFTRLSSQEQDEIRAYCERKLPEQRKPDPSEQHPD